MVIFRTCHDLSRIGWWLDSCWSCATAILDRDVALHGAGPGWVVGCYWKDQCVRLRSPLLGWVDQRLAV